ncbi:MAG: ABC transporter ATP-binding protein [Woeseiaceae bacterium]|nr:ABC transporter ATP-binding protein [Woeseiaceae bacterium]
MSDVEFSKTTKIYDDGTHALDSLELKINEGEFLALLGPSGCGKSTALRLLAGLEDITSGEIRIGGERVNDLPAGARGLGMVFQSYALYPHMSVRDNLEFGLRRAKGGMRVDEAEIARRVDEATEMLDLGMALGKKPKDLSGGQQQRVAIGRALVRRPKVLLMDEPLSNLDAKLRNRMRFEIRRLHEMHGTTTVYVTHDQIEAMTLADRIAIIADGKLQQHAKPLDAYNQPANSFVGSFLGTPAMNLVEGEAHNGVFRAGDLSFDLPEHLAGWQGPGIFGVRPEDVRIVDSGGTRFRVGGVERLGGEAIYHLEAGGHWIKALWHRSGGGLSSAAEDHAELNVSLAVPTAVIFED